LIVEKSRFLRPPNFEVQAMAVDRVTKLLRSTTEALDAAGIEYAVVGGNAVAAWVATVDEDAIRATKDVDVLVRRSDLPAIGAALLPLGLVPVEVLGVQMFVDRENPSPKSGLHLVIAGELIRPHYAHPAPDPGEVENLGAAFRVLDLPALVAMKLQSYRLIDRAHVQDLAAVGLIDKALVAKLPADLQTRLTETLAEPR
jgi:hypothetical protein